MAVTSNTSDGLKCYTYQKDVQGSTRAVTDTNGQCVKWYEYTDFGETTVHEEQASFDNELCYTGGVYDENTGLYYLNARYYNPETGRFISRDTYEGTSEEPSSLHLYLYCANDPVNYVDPSGHHPLAIALGTAGEYLVKDLAVTIGREIITAAGKALVVTGIAGVVHQGYKKYLRVSAKKKTSKKTKTKGKNKSQSKRRPKSVSLPSYKKIKINMDHIIQEHTYNGLKPQKDKFPKYMTRKEIRDAVMDAYKHCKKMSKQGVRRCLIGYSGNLRIVIWFNILTKTIESAWPK